MPSAPPHTALTLLPASSYWQIRQPAGASSHSQCLGRHHCIPVLPCTQYQVVFLHTAWFEKISEGCSVFTQPRAREHIALLLTWQDLYCFSSTCMSLCSGFEHCSPYVVCSSGFESICILSLCKSKAAHIPVLLRTCDSPACCRHFLHPSPFL